MIIVEKGSIRKVVEKGNMRFQVRIHLEVLQFCLKRKLSQLSIMQNKAMLYLREFL
jgi:hypothetical protein